MALPPTVATREPEPLSEGARPAPRRVTAAYMMRLMTSGRTGGPLAIPPEATGTVAEILRAAQGMAGNQAIAGLLTDLPAPPEPTELPPAPGPEGEHAELRPPDPDAPAPADPAGTVDDAPPATGPEAPPHEAGGAIAPPGAPAARAGPSGGGGAVAPVAPTAVAVAASASATASAMPHPPALATASAVPAPARPPRSRAPAARRIPGPPPIPKVEPSFANLPDPIVPATQRIEAVANRLLPEQSLPTVEASPGGHMPVVAEPDRPITAADRRMIVLGEDAMNRAGLTREGDPPGPGEENGGETRTRLLALRAQLLAEPTTAADGTVTTAVTPPVVTVSTPPMPEPDVTIAEQQLFAAVLARTMVDTEDAGDDILHAIKQDMADYPGGALNTTQYPALDNLGRDQLPAMTTRVTDRVNATARIMGAAGAVLDNAVAARRTELANALSGASATATTDATTAATAAATTADTRLADAAAARAAAEEARRRARAGPPPEPGFRAIAEGSVARIQAKVSEAIARFRLQKGERARELDGARDRVIAAYELAVSADQASTEQANNLGPGQTPPSDAAQLATARRRVNAAINAAREWKDRRVRALRTEVERMKASANATADANITEVENEGAAAFRALRDWGATQEGASEAWWTGTVTDLDRWADAAHETATTWAETEARLARLEMQRDVARLRTRIERSIAADAVNAEGFARLTEDQKRDFIANILSTSREPNFIDQLSGNLRTRQVAEERHAIEIEVDRQLHGLPRGEWEAIEFAAKAKNSSFSARERANAIYSAGYDKVGTDEATIYAQLDGLRPIELEAVTKCYNQRRGNDNALYNDLDEELSGDEWRRAQALMEGDPVAAAVEAIHDAAYGPGTNEPQIMAALRSIEALPEDQRAAARTRLNSLYLERYGESVDSVLSGDLSGSELGQARAIATGDTTAAEAYEMDYALSGGFWGPDASAATAVYERIRTESMALARSGDWTPAEFEAEVARRNAAMGASFEERFANVPAYSWGSGSALENAVGYRFAFDRGNRDMLQGYATGDMDRVDAGRMEAERRSTYADDEVMGNVVRAQYTRALDRAQLEEGPERRAGIDATIRRETEAARRAGTPLTERAIMDRRMALQREMDAAISDRAFDISRTSTAALDRRLTDRYGISLDTMLTQTMSDNTFGRGGALSDARARVEIMRRDAADPAARRERRLDWAYARVAFGIEGVGTDTGELRGGLEGLTPDDMAYLDTRWRREHGNETLREAVQGDTSGREEDDLVDVVDHGTALTTKDRVEELRRRLGRDEAGVGWAGARASRAESRESRASLERLEAMSAELDDPNLSTERRAHLSGVFDQRVENARLAIDAQRAAVDSFADNFTTILQYVIGAVAIVLGAILGVVTGGAAVPALIAIAGSVIGTLSGMAAKAAIKGSAYGAEEITTDLVVGAVDLVVTLATVGAFKGAGTWAREGGKTILGAAREGLRTMGRASVRATLRQVAGRGLATAAERAVGQGLRPSIGQRAAAFGRAFVVDQARDLVTGIPAAMAGAVMNEQNWRHGNLIGNIAHGTWEASLENLKNGMVMGLGGHVVHAGVGRFMHVEHRAMTPVEARAREYRSFRAENPNGTHADFVARMEAEAAAASNNADAVRAATREARRELLGAIPPAERRAISDVPILHVGEAQFRALNGGNFGDAMVYVHDGQAVVVVREGAPLAALRGIGAEVRQVVAPGTGGRTVNPVDSLPARLRNRVEVEVVNDSSFGPDEVRAVPQRDRAGNIIGVALQIGPNARAADIQNHVGTIDAMRRYAGAAGRARLLLNDLGRAIGFDLVSPRDRGHWEAMLEVAKLPRIIEDRMTRLSEQGLDPRRRALVMEEIAGLERQLSQERERLALGADAQERGYVAAKSTKRPPAAPAAPEPDMRERLRGQEILTELSGIEPGLLVHERAFAQLEAAPENAMHAIQTNIEMLTARRGDAPPPAKLAEILELIQGRDLTGASARLAEWLATKPATPPPELLREMHPTDRAMYERFDLLRRLQGEYETGQARFVAERDAFLERIEPLRQQVDALRAELDSLRMFNGIALHPALPDPVAGLLYRPDARTLEAQQAHLNGYLAEVRLANHIAHQDLGIVIDYGHAVGVNYADVISIDSTTGRVTLWDSKYRGEGSAARHSETFTDARRLTSARNQALDLLNGSSHGLTPEIRAKAIDFLTNWDFEATTSHTNGGPFRHETINVRKDPTKP
ncbi:hypothetical protein [Sphingomonas sp. Root241]|uniref:hypothetical protein n=1 Tax=Sphingomonas sp. Root241 TaxID=1736501 RepID=UPI000702264F|nr:hypothetical protein [Sphingomonas sp. Root241]KRC81838.1 hypothetical protein ASE13_05605 [Sphingomonas sp. Root241]